MNVNGVEADPGPLLPWKEASALHNPLFTSTTLKNWRNTESGSKCSQVGQVSALEISKRLLHKIQVSHSCGFLWLQQLQDYRQHFFDSVLY